MPENRDAEGCEVREGVSPPCWGGSRDGTVPPVQKILKLFDLQMVCFGVFCGAKFNILVTTKTCKNHTLNALGTRADVTKRNKHLLAFFLTSPTNTNQLDDTPFTERRRFHDFNNSTGTEGYPPYPG